MVSVQQMNFLKSLKKQLEKKDRLKKDEQVRSFFNNMKDTQFREELSDTEASRMIERALAVREGRDPDAPREDHDDW